MSFFKQRFQDDLLASFDPGMSWAWVVVWPYILHACMIHTSTYIHTYIHTYVHRQTDRQTYIHIISYHIILQCIWCNNSDLGYGYGNTDSYKMHVKAQPLKAKCCIIATAKVRTHRRTSATCFGKWSWWVVLQTFQGSVPVWSTRCAAYCREPRISSSVAAVNQQMMFMC